MGHVDTDYLTMTVRAVETLNPFLERIHRTQTIQKINHRTMGLERFYGSREGINAIDGTDERVAHSLSRLLVDLTLTDVVFRQPENEQQEAAVVSALLSDITL